MSGGRMRKRKEQDENVSHNEYFDNFTFDQTRIKPSGYTSGDGFLRLSFTLPMPFDNRAKVAARVMAEKMGLKNIKLLHAEPVDPFHTYCEIEAFTAAEVDATAIVTEPDVVAFDSMDAISDYVENRLRRRLTVIGACLGAESNSVVMDTLFTTAGYMGEVGLEAYPCFAAANLRAEFDMQTLVKKLVDVRADAVVICKVATPKGDDPVIDMRRFVRSLEQAEGLPKHLVKICVNPRMTSEIARDLGYDAGFGAGTLPLHVAQFIVQTIADRI